MSTPRKRTSKTQAAQGQDEPRGDGTQPEVGVWREDDDTWSGGCTSVRCGAVNGDAFTTSGWPTKDSAADRIRQHRDEHEHGTLMQPLDEFRRERGLYVTSEGAVRELPKGATKLE